MRFSCLLAIISMSSTTCSLHCAVSQPWCWYRFPCNGTFGDQLEYVVKFVVREVLHDDGCLLVLIRESSCNDVSMWSIPFPERGR